VPKAQPTSDQAFVLSRLDHLGHSLSGEGRAHNENRGDHRWNPESCGKDRKHPNLAFAIRAMGSNPFDCRAGHLGLQKSEGPSDADYDDDYLHNSGDEVSH
jgi:hypothetical protein